MRFCTSTLTLNSKEQKGKQQDQAAKETTSANESLNSTKSFRESTLRYWKLQQRAGVLQPTSTSQHENRRKAIQRLGSRTTTDRKKTINIESISRQLGRVGVTATFSLKLHSGNMYMTRVCCWPLRSIFKLELSIDQGSKSASPQTRPIRRKTPQITSAKFIQSSTLSVSSTQHTFSIFNPTHFRHIQPRSPKC